MISGTLASVCLLWGCKEDKSIVETVDGKKPNIIFILTDDQSWDALGFAGNDIIHTPHMDNLAEEGLYFENTFVTTSICAASRASIFTGLYERTHDFTFGKPPLDDRYMYKSYPYLLREAGYRKGFVGKFGVRVNDGIEDALFDYFETTSWPYLKEIDGEEVHLADIEGDLAIDFIKSSTEKDQPFCLSLSFWAPHADDGAEEQYFWPDYVDHLYRDVEIPVPETADPEFFENLPEFLQTTMNRVRWYWRFDTPEKHQEMVKGYYRMVSTVDSVLARIRLTLEEEKIADNTVIIFTSDNGYFLGERGYAGKWLLHEQSVKIPLIIYDPRQPESRRGKTYEEMVLNIDFAPTILRLAGVDIPELYQGECLTAFYNGAPDNWRDGIFLEHRWKNDLIPRTDGYRDDTYKFIRYDDHPFIELYNHREDVHEKVNLAYEPEYAGKVEYYTNKCDSIAERLLLDRLHESQPSGQ